MSERIDSVSRFISAPPSAIYAAFADPKSMVKWLPPKGMTATLIHFDFREGGSYRIRLSYDEDGTQSGKTSENTDEAGVRFVRLVEGERIEQEVRFESGDPGYSGAMRMIWTFEKSGSGTLVAIRAENVPPGIRPEDHEAGMNSTLDNLASFLGHSPIG